LLYPCLALLFYIVARDPQLMVKIGGFAQAATLPMIASAAVYFRYFKVHRHLRPWPVTDLLLWVALISIFVVAAYAIPSQVLDIFKFLTGS
jgi:hypothetical protein